MSEGMDVLRMYRARIDELERLLAREKEANAGFVQMYRDMGHEAIVAHRAVTLGVPEDRRREVFTLARLEVEADQ